MTKKDLDLIADTFAYCEAHTSTDEEVELLEWLVEKMGEAIAAKHPRFNRGRFEKYALPIKSKRLRDSIIAKVHA